MQTHTVVSRARLLITIALLVAACDTAPEIRLLFDRGAEDLSLTVVPSDRFSGEVVLDNFSESQLELFPFLRQLRFTAQTGWAPTTGIRIPFTLSRNDPDGWLDLASARAGLRLYRLGDTEAQPLPLGELSYDGGTGGLLVRPLAPFTSGRYAIVALTGRLLTLGGQTVQPSIDAQLVHSGGDPETDAAFAAVASIDPDIGGRSDTLAFVTFTVADTTPRSALLAAAVRGDAPVAIPGHEDPVTMGLSPFLPEEGRQLAIIAQPVADGDAAIDAVFTANGLDALPRDAIARITGGMVVTPNFISDPIPELPALFTNHTIVGQDPSRPFSPDNPPALSASAPFRPLPFVAFFPKVALPDRPILVALHPLSSRKEAFFAFAQAACQAGHALIAIDLFQHGARQSEIVPPEGDFSERVDVILAGLGQAFPDPFFNLTFLARTLDRFRQSLIDTLALIRILEHASGADPRVDIDADGQPDAFGAIRVLGHSLGAMVGAAAAALSPSVDRVVLAAPGAHLMQVLDESPEVGGRLGLLMLATGNAEGIGLMAGSPRRLVPDSAERELFSRIAETVLSPADPAAWLGALVARGDDLRVLVQLPARDLVFTPSAQRRFGQGLGAIAAAAGEDFGLLGDDLLELGWPAAQGLPRIGAATFDAGHAFLLDFVDPAVTAAAQGQAATFLASP